MTKQCEISKPEMFAFVSNWDGDVKRKRDLPLKMRRDFDEFINDSKRIPLLLFQTKTNRPKYTQKIPYIIYI